MTINANNLITRMLIFTFARKCQKTIFQLLSLLTLFISSHLWATCSSSVMSISVNNISLSVPLNGSLTGKPLGTPTSSTKDNVFDMTSMFGGSSGCNVSGGAEFSYAAPAAGLTNTGRNYVDGSTGKSFVIYTAPGFPANIGFIFSVKDPNINQTDEAPMVGVPGAWVQIFPYPGSVKTSATIGYTVRIALVALGELKSGTYQIPAFTLADLKVYNSAPNASVPPPTQAKVNGFTLSIAAATCNLLSAKNQVITMPPVFIAAGGSDLNSPTNQATFSVDVKCNAGVTAYATMTDVNNPASTGNILQLSANSTAKGIGLQLFKNGESTPVSFGPDSAVAGNTNQWYVGGSANALNNAVYNIRFLAKYIVQSKNGYNDVKSGTFEAEASITFSYQ